MDEPRMSEPEEPKPLEGEVIGEDRRGSAKPLKGKCGAKLRKSKPARYCIKDPVSGRKRCRLHGGVTPQGLESANTKHGLRSAYLPKGLKERYETAHGDSQLMRIRDDVALVEGLLAHYTSGLKPDKVVTVRQEQRVLALVEQRRKLIESEARRLKDLHQMITIERYLAQMTVVGNLIRKHITDQGILDALHADLQRHLMAPAKEGDDEG